MRSSALSKAEIARLTQARLTLGPRGRAVDTSTSLGFALDHARAREAVLAEIDTGALSETLAASGLETCVVTSAAETRDTYIKRPDLGRSLPAAAAADLERDEHLDVVLVLGDGLSGVAVALNGPAFMVALSARLQHAGLRHGPVVLARQARVALGDKVSLALGARTVVMALGERPGLSAADSLGIYITQNPQNETADSARNCISNVREAGLSVEAAADQTLTLITAMRAAGHSGVALSQSLATGALTGDTPD